MSQVHARGGLVWLALFSSILLLAISFLASAGPAQARDSAYPLHHVLSLPGFTLAGAADLNRDGRPDLLVEKNVLGPKTHRASLFFLRGRGDGSFAAPKRAMDPKLVQRADGPGERGLTLANVAGDRHLDALYETESANGAADIRTLIGGPHGMFGPDQAATVTLPSPSNYAVSDLNGDGYADLATVDSAHSELDVRLNTAGLRGPRVAFGEPTSTHVDVPPTYPPDEGYGEMALSTVTAGRFDSKRGKDLMLLAASGEPQYDMESILMRGDGGGGFVETAESAAMGGGPAAVSGNDLDGDGLTDLEIETSNGFDGGLQAGFTQADGTILAHHLADRGGPYSDSGIGGDNLFPTVTSGDFNGDGFNDLAGPMTLHVATKATFFIAGNGEQTVATAQLGGAHRSSQASCSEAFADDFNHDGADDLAYSCPVRSQDGQHVAPKIFVYLGTPRA